MSISNCEPHTDFGVLSMKSRASEFSGGHSNVQKNLHKVLLRTKNICFFVVLYMMFLPGLALGETATISWDPNPEPDIAGYKVFYGTSSGNYTDCITVNSTQTSCEITGLQGGNTYYFAVKAVDASGQESEFSSEVSKYIPAPIVPPNADIQVNANHGIAPFEVILDAGLSSDSDGNIVQYSWQFGDGSSATGVTTSHIYNTQGTYTVTLTVTDNVGASDTETLQIEVISNQPPEASMVLSRVSGYAPLAIDFDASGSSDSDGSIVEYDWDFGDEATGRGSSVSHTYNTPGSYTVTLAVTDDKGAVDSATAVIEVWQGYVYTWQFGDGQDADLPGTVEDTYINLNDQNYSDNETLRLYTWPADKAANAIIMKWDLSAIPGDAEIREAMVQLYMSDMEADGGDDPYDVSVHRIVNHDPVISVCSGSTYDGVNGWTHHGDDNITLAQSDIASEESIVSVDKTYDYKAWDVPDMVQHWVTTPTENYGLLLNADTTASADSNRCFVSSENGDSTMRPKLIVTFVTSELINLPPMAKLSAEPMSGQAPLLVSFDGGASQDPDSTITGYHWDFGDSIGGEGAQISHTYQDAGTYPVTLTVTDGHGATDSASMEISVTANSAPVAVIDAGPLSGYAPLAVILNAVSSSDNDGLIVSYNWDFGDNSSQVGVEAEHIYNISGNHVVTLTVTDDGGATGTATVTVQVTTNSPPEILAFSANPTEFDNPPGKVTFTCSAVDNDNDNLSYSLDFGDGKFTTSLPASHDYTEKATYEAVLTVADDHGHEVSQAVTIVVNDIRPRVPLNVTVALTD
jgi:PKD repeat protein